ncbi:MAG TPA: valine--tRNA ligase [Candidatus Paceibacterota bacterium]|nr:valine--tRNA ligase [Candidatus Paceibacterota bacterium]
MQNGTVPEKLLKPYNPTEEEPSIYAAWEQSGYFNPEKMIADGLTAPDAEPFTIVLPPPNVTAALHMGSALMLAIEDIIVRYKRMRGFRTLWIPGTDSAAIATQSKVEKEIQKSEGKSRYDLGREELLRRIDIFVEETKGTIINQTKRFGTTLDWSRYAYTMDEKRYRAVMEAFKRMYDAGLIYRAHKIVNWDPKGQTTISDDEIVYEPRKATLYTFKYSKDFPIAISTTRPETKVGDVAVAVHPDDNRYASYVGNEYDVTFCGVPIHIKVVADASVEKEFGTGALGVTPAHSFIDWEIADRHDLPRPQVIDERAKMLVGDERLQGKKVAEAREAVVTWLREEGLIEKEETVDQNIATAERTGGIIEPLPKLQWFVDVHKPISTRGGKTLKELMQEPIASGAITIIPDYFDKTYFHWIDNLRDWCISRQIWFGHRIPMWYKGDEMRCSIDSPGEGWEQDPDVLDTWFSSALWTFSTLSWPDESNDLKIYHPTSLLETGYDILFFWVARMILMSQFHLGEVPFKTVYLHGLVRDAKGQKISKSLGNNIDPLEMGAKYGMDAVRMSLIAGMAPGTDSKISEEKIKGYKHFANKLWNITRFVLTNYEGEHNVTLSPNEHALLDEWSEVKKKITNELDAYRLHTAAETAYHYLWHTFADVIIEESKPLLANADTGASRQKLLYTILSESLIVLHPFMPFVTESLWQLLPAKNTSLLMITPWSSN